MIESKPIQLTTEELRTIWDYKDGELWWKERRRGRRINRPAGASCTRGYHQIKLNKRLYLIHRLIWLWHGRELVDGFVIDHIDNNPSNNRIENLQQISQGENLRRREYVKKPKGCVFFYKHTQK